MSRKTVLFWVAGLLSFVLSISGIAGNVFADELIEAVTEEEDLYINEDFCEEESEFVMEFSSETIMEDTEMALIEDFDEVLVDENDNITAPTLASSSDDDSQIEKVLTLSIKAIASVGNGVPATFRFMDDSGEWITDENGNSYLEYDGITDATAVFKEISSVTIVQTGISENYVIVGPAQQIKTEGTDYTYSTTDGKAACSVVFTNATVATTTESIRVRKEWYVGANNRVYNASNDAGVTFYLALFSDKAKTNRVSQVYEATAANGEPYATMNIGHLPAGTYYVAETDAAGVTITSNSDISSVTYAADADGKVTIRNSGSTIHNVTVKNHYYSLPTGFEYVGQVGICKQILTANGEVDTSFNGSIKVQIRYMSGDKELSQTKTLSVSKGKSSYYVYYVPLGNEQSKDVTVYEAYIGSDGTTEYAESGMQVILEDKIYNVSISSPTVTVAAAQSTTPLVTVANTEESEPTHSHSNIIEQIIIQPTCVNTGSKSYICSDCGETIRTEVIPMTGHTVVVDPAVEATTTTEGKTVGSHCSVCGTVIIAQETIPKLVKQSKVETPQTDEPIPETTLKVTAKGLKKNKVTLKRGKTLKLKAVSNKPVTFKTNKKKVVSVTKKGKLKALKKGKATITITAGDKTIKIKVTVK